MTVEGWIQMFIGERGTNTAEERSMEHVGCIRNQRRIILE